MSLPHSMSHERGEASGGVVGDGRGHSGDSGHEGGGVELGAESGAESVRMIVVWEGSQRQEGPVTG